ncbi:hypothetical protein V8J88_07815 [Massilia sp. W12]|uniref:NACHT domain-containing protein n=1 Tax=Massilia sp. W12 TaxID=3126507 RepID=UPI0030D17FDC
MSHNIQPPQGDPARQALASLGGYAYQLYASCLAWLRLLPQQRLYLEVAEDYALQLQQAVQAVQVKNSASNISILSPDVLTAIDALIDLQARNPQHDVSLQFLTTASIACEQRLQDRINNGPVLSYWPLAAQGAEVQPLRTILLRAKLKQSSLDFIAARDDAALRRDLLSRITWVCGQSDLSALRAELDQQAIDFGSQILQIEPDEAQRLAGAMLQTVLDTILTPGARCLTQADLRRLNQGINAVSIPKRELQNLLRQQDSEGQRQQAALAELQAWSQALAQEMDVAGHKRLQDGRNTRDESEENQGQSALRLSEGLYVQRKEGVILTHKIDALLQGGPGVQGAPRIFIVRGEAGHGKTSLLWWLQQRYAAQADAAPLFLRAAWLGACAGAIRISAARLTEACALLQQQGQTAIVLIDTVDLLVRSEEDASVLMKGVLASLHQLGAIVVLTSRPQEARRLKAADLPSTHLDLIAYDDSELQDALARYAARYYRSQGAGVDVAQHFARIERAVAQGKPVKQICAIPLALRMLFEIYAPDSIPEEIHIVDLYQAYWRNRVEADVRAAYAEHDSPAPASGANHAPAAMWLAALMLAQGSVELEADSIDWLWRQQNLARAALDDLLHRGIVQRGPGGALSFFHQTFFEHAAARAMLYLLPQAGLQLLAQRVAARTDDLFIKPVLQHALLLAEPMPQLQALRQTVFSQLLQAQDIADQSLALYVYCHWKRASPAPCVAQVQAHLLQENCEEALQIEFLRFAGNLASARSQELLPLLGPLWQRPQQALRRRKHIMHLLARLAWRWPQAVSALLDAWQAYDYVFHKERMNDDITVSLLETVGNAWLRAQADADAQERAASLPALRQRLLYCLQRALAAPFHFSLAEQWASLIGQAQAAEMRLVLQACSEMHAQWDKAIEDGRSRKFNYLYCSLWLRAWQAAQTPLASLLSEAQALTQAGPSAALSLHLMTLAQSLICLPPVALAARLPELLSWLTQHASSHWPICWVDRFLGPLFRHCLREQIAPEAVSAYLQTRLLQGLAQRAQRLAGLGVATRLIQYSELSGPELAQVFAPAADSISPQDWRAVRELNRLLFAAQLAGIAAARQAFAGFVQEMRADKAFLSTLQQQLIQDYERSGALREAVLLLRLIGLSGDSTKLLTIAPELRQRMQQEADIASQTTRLIAELLRSPSSTVRSAAVQNLPALVQAGLFPLPDASLALQLLQGERVAKNHAHTAKWVANAIDLDQASAHTLALEVRTRLLQVLQPGAGDAVFLKESYLEIFAALIRRGLLNPAHALGGDMPGALPLAQELLSCSLAAPLTERHLTLFGRSISSVAAQNAHAALRLLQQLFTAPAIAQLGQGARRDLARHLRAPVRDIFSFGEQAVWHAMLEMCLVIDYRLARAIIEAAMEKRALELGERLEAMRQDGQLHGDLRKLIFTWKHHHERSDGGQAWLELLQHLPSTTGSASGLR